jgi:hypothetical protein
MTSAKKFALLTLPLTLILLAIHYLVWPDSFGFWPVFYPLIYVLLTLFIAGAFLLTGKLKNRDPQLAVYAVLGLSMVKMFTILILVLIAAFRFESIPQTWVYPLILLYFSYLLFAVIGSIRIVKN